MKVAYKITLPLVIVITILIWFVTDTFNNTQLKIVKDGQKQTAVKITDQFEKNKQRVLKNLQENIDFSSNMIAEVSAKYLYDFDFEALNTPLIKFLEDKNIKAIEVYEKTQKKPVVSIGKKQEQYKVVKKNIVWENAELLGYANIYYDDRYITYYFQFSKQELLDQINLTNKGQDQFIDKILTQRTYVNFSITIVVIIILLVTIYLTVLRPLEKLEKGLNSFFQYLQNKSDNVEKIEIKTNDEFGKMGKSLNENIAVTAKLHEEIYQLNLNLEEKIAKRTHQLKEKTEQISQLLDNAEEGFLSFGQTLLVDSEYSKECEYIFQKAINDENIINLLFTKEAEEKELFTKVMNDIFNPKLKKRKKEVFLQLLPKEFSILNNYIKVEYKIISPEKLMLILVDITEKKKLQEKIELEKNILKMIVSVVSDIQEFKDLVHEYYTFCESTKEYIGSEKRFLNDIIEYYRMIHTFKGNFAQKDLVYIVPMLHQYESKINNLIKNPNRTFEQFKELIQSDDISKWLDKDIEVLDTILDHKILDKDDTISVPISLVCKIEEEVKLILHYTKDKRDITYEDLLEDVASMRKRTLYDLLKSYPKSVEQLAKRLNKKIYQMQVVGGENIFVSNKVNYFIKSLIHIFRNSIDHGIETLQERIALNKDESATISCDIQNNENSVIINIVDDGRGIDTGIIKQKALEKGIFTEDEIANMSRSEILMTIFKDTFSTKEEITQLSGRGVGLAAVKGEIEKLDGSIEIDTTPEKGTTFKFTIPLKSIT